MPTRALHMRKIRELIRLKYEARLSHEQIAGALAISKGVVAKYVARIERTGQHGLFSAFYSDRGSHYWLTPEAGGKVDRRSPTQFGRAVQQLGIEMIAAYSPQARGRSERAFHTHQERLVRELADAGIQDMAGANEYLHTQYRPAFNLEFARPALEVGSAFVPLLGVNLQEILCEHFERQVWSDNCVSFQNLKLQIPKQRHRCHFVKVKVRVHRHLDDTLAIYHGPRCLAATAPKAN